MRFNFPRLALCLSTAAALALYGCGGSDSATPLTPPAAVAPPATTPPATTPPATTPPATTPPAATTTDVPVTVVDGPIRNATVCMDKNNNGLCDTGEPTGKTGAGGKLTLKVDNADVGKFAILALVGTDSIDEDVGTVTVPFTMRAPADKPAVVSPLTTLVQRQITNFGGTSAQAEATVKQQLGINVSLFEDFTQSTTTDSRTAGTVARLLVVTTQQQSTALASTVGTTAIDGNRITAADLDKLIQNRLLEILPELITALANSTAQTASTTVAKEAALLAAAQGLVAGSSTGLTTTSVATIVAINNQTGSTTPVVAVTPEAGAALRLLNYFDPTNWSGRVFVATLAQATPDAGMTRSVQRRYNTVSGQTAAWTTIGSSPSRQSDLHFNGSAWVGCALNSEDKNSVRDANGNSTFNTCDSYETGSSNRALFPIAGKTMIEVYNQITAAGFTNLTINGSPTVVLGTATFPANSTAIYQASTVRTSAPAYYPGTGNRVSQYSAGVAAGGLNTTACNSTEFQGNGTESATLESLISVMRGTPCDFTGSNAPSFVYGSVTYTSPEVRNEAWSNSTLSIGILGTAPVGFGVAPGFYTGNTRLRMAFTGVGTNAVTYYSCKERFNTGSTRNCTAIGTGSYTITTQGDARIMTLSNPPQIFSGLGYERVFVERAGKIYFGYKNKLGVFNNARLNLPATNALFAKLGLPAVNVDTPLALTKTSYAGQYRLASTGALGAFVTIFINQDGSTSSTYTSPTGITGPSENTVITFTNLATGEFTSLTTGTGVTGSGTVNFLTGDVTVNLNDPTSTPPNVTLVGTRR